MTRSPACLLLRPTRNLLCRGGDLSMTSKPSSPVAALAPVFAYIDAHQQEFVERLIDYVRRPSISASGVGMGEVADHLLVMLKRMGLQSQLVPTAGWPMVFGRSAVVPDVPT